MRTPLRTCFLVMALGTWVSCEPDVVDPNERLQEELAVIDSHLASLGITAYRHSLGIRFTVEQLGTGLPPRNVEQPVRIKYTGRLLDGTIFEEGTAQRAGTELIPGVSLGLALLPEGTKATLYIPSVLAYGNSQFGNIPPNSNLAFEVEVQDVVWAQSELDQLTKDVKAIDDYLLAQSIVATQDTTGIRYLIKAQGIGSNATRFNKVQFTYVAKYLDTEAVVVSGVSEANELFDSIVANYIIGVQLALQKMNLGSKATVYIPSGLAFGLQGTRDGAIQSNANLIWELELTEIEEFAQ